MAGVATPHSSPLSPYAAHKARLAWQCRRGMLELDLLLQDFIDKHYDQLAPAGKQAFETLLAYPDSLLYEYFLGSSVPVESALANVVAKIRGPAQA